MLENFMPNPKNALHFFISQHNRYIRKVRKRQHQYLEFGHTQGEIKKKPAKKYIRIQGSRWNSETIDGFWVSPCLSFFSRAPPLLLLHRGFKGVKGGPKTGWRQGDFPNISNICWFLYSWWNTPKKAVNSRIHYHKKLLLLFCLRRNLD